MSHRNFIIAFIAIAAFVITGVFAEEAKSTGACPVHSTSITKGKAQTSSAKKAVIEEDIVIIAVEVPEKHFKKAHENFLKKDMKASAAEIRKAGEFVKKEAGRVKEDTKKVLLVCAADLEKLAKDVEKGAIKTEKELKDGFARFHYDLAKLYQKKAHEHWLKKKVKRTGYDLKAAVVHLEHAASWAGHKLEAGTSAVVKDTRLVSGKLIQGTGYVSEKVGKGIETLGKEIEKCGKKVEPKKK